MNEYFEECPTCGGNYLVKVSENDKLEFYSCTNDDCVDHAILFVNFEGKYIKVSDMIEGMEKVKNEFITSN